MEEMLNHCGFDSAFDMIRTHLTEDELLDLLSELLHENKSIAYEICEEIASDKYDWVDWEQVKADADDAAYQAYRDRRFDND